MQQLPKPALVKTIFNHSDWLIDDWLIAWLVAWLIEIRIMSLLKLKCVRLSLGHCAAASIRILVVQGLRTAWHVVNRLQEIARACYSLPAFQNFDPITCPSNRIFLFLIGIIAVFRAIFRKVFTVLKQTATGIQKILVLKKCKQSCATCLTLMLNESKWCKQAVSWASSGPSMPEPSSSSSPRSSSSSASRGLLFPRPLPFPLPFLVALPLLLRFFCPAPPRLPFLLSPSLVFWSFSLPVASLSAFATSGL